MARLLLGIVGIFIIIILNSPGTSFTEGIILFIVVCVLAKISDFLR